jgi:hypothetical protein
MSCDHVRRMFSPYWDRTLTGAQMQSLSAHLTGCGACRMEYVLFEGTQRLVASAGRVQAPADLAARLNVAIKLEKEHRSQPWFGAWLVRMENGINAFMLPATAGLVSAVVFFAFLITILFTPARLDANDVPIAVYTPPQLTGTPADGIGPWSPDAPVLVETLVDANGRVQDYRILDGPEDDRAALKRELDRILIFTTFRPATSFGKPSVGRAVISFSNISVKG